MKRLLIFFLLFSNLVSSGQKIHQRIIASGSPAPVPVVAFNANLIVLIGQSNAVGVGDIADFSSPYTGVLTGTKIWNKDASPAAWEDIEGGVNNSGSYTTYTGHAGVELKLMYDWYESDPVEKRIIKFGQGGTGLSLVSGSALRWHPSLSGEMFDLAHTQVTAAMADMGDTRPPKALIIIQGEQDAYYSQAAADDYQTSLEAWIAAERTFFSYPTMPVIIVRLGDGQSGASYAYKSTVIAAQNAVASQDNNYIVSADGQAAPDGSHYEADGYNTIAERILTVLLSL